MIKTIIQFGRALMTAAIIAASAQAESITYTAKTGSELKISGTSSVHDWEVKTRLIGGKMIWDSSFPLNPSKAVLPKLTATPKISVIVPVRNIESGKQRMNEVMHGAMNAEKHKYARYNLTKIKLADTKRKVAGKTKLKMSQFGIVPPAPKIALGLITTGDEVTVEFSWFVAPKK